MSVLEFVSSIKWPVTVLLLAAMGTLLLKRNPETRRSLGTWFNRRNLRVNLAGQEFEATVAETQSSMDLAAGADHELAETVAEAGAEAAGPENLPYPLEYDTSAAAVEQARRVAVEITARNAVRLGWLWALGEDGATEPEVAVRWTSDGHPSLRIRTPGHARREGERIVREILERPEVARKTVRELLDSWDRGAAVRSDVFLGAAARRRLRRVRRGRDVEDGGPPTAPQGTES